LYIYIHCGSLDSKSKTENFQPLQVLEADQRLGKSSRNPGIQNVQVLELHCSHIATVMSAVAEVL